MGQRQLAMQACADCCDCCPPGSDSILFEDDFSTVKPGWTGDKYTYVNNQLKITTEVGHPRPYYQRQTCWHYVDDWYAYWEARIVDWNFPYNFYVGSQAGLAISAGNSFFEYGIGGGPDATYWATLSTSLANYPVPSKGDAIGLRIIYHEWDPLFQAGATWETYVNGALCDTGPLYGFKQSGNACDFRNCQLFAKTYVTPVPTAYGAFDDFHFEGS